MKKITKILAAGATLTPFLALAQATNANFGWINSVVNQVGAVIATLIPVLIALALLVFVWGVVKFIAAADDSARDDGKKKMIWGIVGLFVIISVWGLVALLRQLVGINAGTAPNVNIIPAGLNTTP